MAGKSIIIVGAGLAGLATGCYGQMNGYRTKAFERRDKAGGVCVSWKRKGYTFDYALHNLFGTIPGRGDNVMWNELGALRGLETHRFEEMTRVEDGGGKALTFYTDLDKLEKHLTELSPGDGDRIGKFVKACRRLRGYDLFAALSGGGLWTKLRMLPVVGIFARYGRMTVADYAEGFKDPFLRKAFLAIHYDLPYVPVIVPMMLLAEMSRGDGGWPAGGSAALSKNVERRYLELGGEIVYRSSVAKILIEDDRAVGVQLEDGSQHRADIVVSAADGYSTIFEMLEGKYVSGIISSYYKSHPKTGAYGLEVCYGANLDLSREPHSLVLLQDKPLKVEGRETDRLNVEIFNFDASLAPPRKVAIKVIFESDYDYWRKLSGNKKAYANEKRKIADAVAARLEKRFPGLRKRIEVVDVVTPVSVEHFTAAHRGGLPWLAPKEIARQVTKNGVSRTLPGLRGFHMVGQWAGALFFTGGVCQMGRSLVRRLCKQDGKKFVATSAG